MFANPYVRTILLSRILLQLGIWVRNFAVLLYVTDITGNNPTYVSFISVVEYAPIFIFAIIGGTVADRWQPKRTMVSCDLLASLSVVAVLVAVTQGAWYALLAGTFISASLSQFSQPSAMKLYKNNLPEELLPGVMALTQSLVAVFMILGPVAGSFVYLQFGIEVSLVATVVLFLGSSLILAALPKDAAPSRQDRRQTGMWTEMRAGFGYLWRNQALRTLSSVFTVSGLAVGLIQPLLLFICLEHLGQDKSFLQYLIMVNGASMLAGGILIMTVAKRMKPQLLLTIGLFFSALSTVGTGASTYIPLSLAFQVISGLFYPCIQVGIQMMIMQNTEGAYIGRVSGAITPIFMGMILAGIGLSGYLKTHLSLFGVYASSMGLLLLGVLLMLPLLRGKSQSILHHGQIGK